MDNRLIKETRVPVSRCDKKGNMDLQGVFTLFMDMASEHAVEIGMGMDALLHKGLIWLAVKSKMKIHRMPQMFSHITATTWPAEPGRIRCDRLYKMMQGDELLIEGKTEWAMYEPATGKLRKMENGYPKDLQVHPEIVCEGPYARIKDDFEGCEIADTYTVKATDLDTSCHMNNVEYIKLVLGVFHSDVLAEMDIAEIEIAYKNQCYEGEQLTIRKKQIENGYDIGIFKADGTPGALARIVMR